MMSMNNTNPEKKTRFRLNLIDFVIIFALLACAAGIYLRYTVSPDKMIDESSFVEAKVEFLIFDVNEQLADALVAGSPAFDPSGTPIGELSAVVQKLPAEIFVTLDDGSIIKTYSDALRFDVRGILTVKGLMTEKGFMLNGTDYIAPGAGRSVLTPQADFYLLVTNITLDE